MATKSVRFRFFFEKIVFTKTFLIMLNISENVNTHPLKMVHPIPCQMAQITITYFKPKRKIYKAYVSNVV